MIELLRRFGGKFRRYMVIGPACKLIEVIFDLLTPLVIAQMIDEGIGAHDVSAVVHYGMVLAAMAVIGISFTLVCQKMAALTSQGMGTDIRGALYQHINKLSYAELDRFGTPSLITRITNDVNQVQLAVALGVRMLIRWPFLAVGSMVAALAIDLKLGMIFLICTPAIGLVFWFVMARCIPYYRQLQAKLDRIALICREGLSGARVVRAFVREGHERERFAQAADDQANTAIAVGKLSSILNPVTFLVMNLGVCAILWVGGIQVNVGDLTQGQVMAFVNYMTQTLTSIVYVANLVVVFTKASASASRINEVLNCVPSISDESNQPVALPKPGNVAPVPALSLSHVSFSFGAGAANAVNDVTLELPLGKTLGIIGGTGSGKSTLVSLIPRLYDASAGRVSVMGADVRTWPLDQLRRVVATVPQRASLVSGTIRSNLTWRDEAATDEELWAALDMAQASEFVHNKPQGLDAPVEAGGKNFSGGQRQRLTIARALVGSPQVLIMDDSASALDFKTDAALRHAIRERSVRGAAEGGLPLTTVIVSQRVSTVRDADMICVLDHGSVAGLGTHDGLYASCQLYREICQSQLRREELEGQQGSTTPTSAPTAPASVCAKEDC
ncbi:ABC transporter ATP-binding protein [Collinsella aerofaciens]|uniref:ABC transporter ATP-binding protein n=1 Tax=Collinsella aerofaciens TaxID=74426 RepID=A0AAW6AKK6_9ACTN|nr:ABC transporter ATP-binding protein [Collinsella aerofaciens]MDB1835684.1 ABC transporter ATP-binding protein [Collinsella aerofaciens]MDB1837626.1 ABC transporter ATP-binding protein [Collinsella aerofaciens]MDB1839023.1 ABC transporter ATP-binding protein [Collinsella aerofaciens]MDB1841499.1 ABC transporter ATP-binding protein [Collinsella aerofaciens]MDB1843411.1 ABC transporter ATP-binding protein [Collinsella aerofaciens]